MADTSYPLGARVAEIREYRGWSQQALAEKVGMHPVALCRLERSHRRPHKELRDDVRGRTLLALARALGCDADYLLGRTDTPRLDKL